jgi:acetoacetyl-CoA reductase
MSERKVAIVTNGMTALGTAICQRLQHDGFAVAVIYPPWHASPEGWLAAQRDEGYAFTARSVDVRDIDACATVVEELVASRGRLDVLVNLATVVNGPPRKMNQVSAADWETERKVTLDGAFNMDKHAVPQMIARQWGRILHITHDHPPGAVGPAAASAGLHGLTKSLALEVARHGVTVNTIVPGQMQSINAATGIDAATVARIPVGRLGTGADVAGLVAYLASESAGYVTGAQLAINGGQHLS